mmetsp:Transcript_8381/g.21363  ORF Transcript_8381/g.21363 Transcript_8381/m.21363 type:complete len:267 (+) Transcript_8381:693-1493(+)
MTRRCCTTPPCSTEIAYRPGLLSDTRTTKAPDGIFRSSDSASFRLQNPRNHSCCARRSHWCVSHSIDSPSKPSSPRAAMSFFFSRSSSAKYVSGVCTSGTTSSGTTALYFVSSFGESGPGSDTAAPGWAAAPPCKNGFVSAASPPSTTSRTTCLAIYFAFAASKSRIFSSCAFGFPAFCTSGNCCRCRKSSRCRRSSSPCESTTDGGFANGLAAAFSPPPARYDLSTLREENPARAFSSWAALRASSSALRSSAFLRASSIVAIFI